MRQTWAQLIKMLIVPSSGQKFIQWIKLYLVFIKRQTVRDLVAQWLLADFNIALVVKCQSPGCSAVIVFLGNTLHSHSGSLHTGKSMGTSLGTT